MSRRSVATPAWWFDGARVPWWASLLAPVYAGVVALRQRLYRSGLLRQRKVAVPVVVIGNLAAGGAGKTPLALAVVRHLRDAGWRPGVASRGHGRRDAATPRWVTAETAAVDGGDEPVLFARRLAVPVRVDRDRHAAALALAEAGCDIVVCDDGLQHYRLARDIEIEVVDGARRYGNGRMLPAGPLREPATRGRRCDFRVVNLGHAPVQDGGIGFGEWPMQLQAKLAVPMVGGRARPLQGFVGMRVHAVAGIGNPQRFFDMLRGQGIGVVPHAFPDHHGFVEGDLDFGNELPVLMTEKDAVKCAGFADARCYMIPVDAELPAAFWIALGERIGRPG